MRYGKESADCGQKAFGALLLRRLLRRIGFQGRDLKILSVKVRIVSVVGVCVFALDGEAAAGVKLECQLRGFFAFRLWGVGP
jgi:hypothetical protein